MGRQAGGRQREPAQCLEFGGPASGAVVNMTGVPVEQRPGPAQVVGEGFLAGSAVVAGVADRAVVTVDDLVQGDLKTK